MANRVELAVKAVTVTLRERAFDPATLAKLEATLCMTFGDHSRFQTLKSVAQLKGEITLEEAQSLYILLGNQVSVFNNRSLAVKVAVTKALAELLGVK